MSAIAEARRPGQIFAWEPLDRTDWLGLQNLVSPMRTLLHFFSHFGQSELPEKPKAVDFLEEFKHVDFFLSLLVMCVNELLAFNAELPAHALDELSGAVGAFMRYLESEHEMAVFTLYDAKKAAEIKEQFPHGAIRRGLQTLYQDITQNAARDAFITSDDARRVSVQLVQIRVEATKPTEKFKRTMRAVSDKIDHVASQIHQGETRVPASALAPLRAFVAARHFLYDHGDLRPLEPVVIKLGVEMLIHADLVGFTNKLAKLAKLDEIPRDETSVAKALISARTSARYRVNARALASTWA